MVLDWADVDVVKENWGDKLNPILAGKISGGPVFHPSRVKGYRGPIYSMIGSHLRLSTRRHVIWGTGFIDSHDTIKAPPAKVCAVRGPLSRQRLRALGIDCPAVYGDAALLYPLFYFPKVAKKFDLGIIQHFREQDTTPLPEKNSRLKVNVISITAGIDEVVDQILSCRKIASSSLHGIIAAHAYGVPAVWVKFSDCPLGDDFKFRDYWSCLGHKAVRPLQGDAAWNCESIYEHDCPIRKTIDLAALIDACPFIDDARRRELRGLAEGRFQMENLVGR